MDISVLVGKTLASVQGGVGDREIVFTTTDGKRYRMYHDQDCSEDVDLVDVDGDLQSLVGSPILRAEESTSSSENPPGFKPPEYGDGSFTWTFYRLATVMSGVTMRWYVESNGYYSESVDFEEMAD